MARRPISRRTVALIPPAVTPYVEQGVVGTVVYGGYVQTRERSSKWVGQQKYITISDMAVNTSIIAAGVSYTAGLVSHPRWSVKPPEKFKDVPEAKAAAELVESCLHDLTLPWSRVVRRAYMYRFYGFGVQEWTAKRRTDGRVGLESVLPRPQVTIERWSTDDSGQVTGVWQRSLTTGELLGIPRGKMMYLVEDTLSDSPEGLGVFRMLAEPWERLKTYYELEARAFERDLRGIPVGKIPYTAINAAVRDGTITKDQAEAMVKAMEDFVQIAITKSNTGVTMDSAPYLSQAQDGDKVAGVPQWDLSLLQGSGNGMADVASAIKRTQFEMATTLCTQHLLYGMEGASGNRALAQDMSQNLYLMANASLSDISSGVNHDIVAPICLLNNVPDEYRPTCQVEDVAFKDADAVAGALAKMAQAGAMLTPDDPVIVDVRELLGVSAPNPVSPELAGMVPAAPEPTAAGDAAAAAALAKVAPRTLYVHRQLLNADAVRAWAASQGIATTLAPDDMHVTVAFSRAPVDWSQLTPDPFRATVLGGARAVYQFPPRSTPNGALVLKFASPQLAGRWQEFRDAGASWDFPEYQPHITLTYSVLEADVAGVVPYAGPLVFGPEVFAEVSEDWANSITEVPTA